MIWFFVALAVAFVAIYLMGNRAHDTRATKCAHMANSNSVKSDGDKRGSECCR